MSFNRKNAFALFAVPLLVVAGCGTDDDTFVKQTTTPSTEVVATAPAPTPAPPETVAPPVAAVQEVTYEIAENAFLNARYGEAVDLFTRYTERKQDNPWGYYMLGLSAWKDGRLDVAETAFQQSLTLDPNHLKSCVNLARVLMDNHRASEALTVLDRALEIDATSSAAHRLKGRAYHDLNRIDDAVAAYRAAIALDPADAWSMNNLAFVWIQQERFEEALSALARAVELRKDVPLFYNNLGMALEHTGHFSAAADAYAFAVDLDTSNTRALLNHDRVAGVREDASLPPVDLAVLAREFESTIDTWKVATQFETKPDSLLTARPE